MGSWGRHGWPKKNEGMRLYQRNGTYLLLEIPDNERVSHYDAIANVLEGVKPSLGSCNIPVNYTYDKGCKRVQWKELPETWQRAFLYWLDDTKPETVRGFWLVGQQPAAV